MRDLKHVLLSLTILIIHNVNAQGTKVTKSQPPKKSTKIIVIAKDSNNTLLDHITGVLYDRGYSIENKDEKVKFVSTKDLPSKKWMTIYKIKARINDTAIIFSGQIAFNKETDIFGMKEVSKTYWDIESGKGGSMREAWNELQGIAQLFGDKIYYSK